MAKALGVLTVNVNDTSYVLELKQIDLVRAEQLLGRSVTRMDRLSDIYEIAWTKLRRQQVDGIPSTFDAFLDLEPDIDADFDTSEDAGGKGSGQEVATG